LKEELKEELIDTAQIDLRGLPEKEFSAAQRFRVWISRQAHETVWQHARQSLKGSEKNGGEIVEIGGILIGKVYKDHEGPFLEVSAAIAGEHTRNQGTQVTFTPETWTQVNRVKDKKYPDASIVGWYHTHPRFGIFLSDMDKFIHKHHFPQPWTTALVVDPVQKSEGFFVWSGGEPSVASEYWVGHERREGSRAIPSAMEDAPPEKPGEVKGPGSPVSRAAFALTVVMCFLGMLVLSGYFYMREVSHSDKEKIVILALGAQRTELQNTAQAIADLRRQLVASREQTDEENRHIQQQIYVVQSRLQNVAVVNEMLQGAVATHQGIFDRWQVAGPQEQPTIAPPQNTPSVPEQPNNASPATQKSTPETPKKGESQKKKNQPEQKKATPEQPKNAPPAQPKEPQAAQQSKAEEKKP
jgi:proteasome lid subunit RPN8/RPN11